MELVLSLQECLASVCVTSILQQIAILLAASLVTPKMMGPPNLIVPVVYTQMNLAKKPPTPVGDGLEEMPAGLGQGLERPLGSSFSHVPFPSLKLEFSWCFGHVAFKLHLYQPVLVRISGF